MPTLAGGLPPGIERRAYQRSCRDVPKRIVAAVRDQRILREQRTLVSAQKKSTSGWARGAYQPTLDRFYAEVRACGARPPFKPTVRVTDSAGIIHYDPPTGSVVLYPWSVADRGMRDDAARRAEGDERPGAARSAYEDIFNEVLVAHELGHWLQSFQPEPQTPEGEYDGWFAEQDANRIAVAFWREHPGPGRSGEERVNAWVNSGPEVPNLLPPPEGVSLESFFTANTMTIVRGGAYGWYQGEMTRRAVAETPAPKFCDLVSRWLPLT